MAATVTDRTPHANGSIKAWHIAIDDIRVVLFADYGVKHAVWRLIEIPGRDYTPVRVSDAERSEAILAARCAVSRTLSSNPVSVPWVSRIT